MKIDFSAGKIVWTTFCAVAAGRLGWAFAQWIIWLCSDEPPVIY